MVRAEQLLAALREECTNLPALSHDDPELSAALEGFAVDQHAKAVPTANQIAQRLNRLGHPDRALSIYEAIQGLYPQSPAG